MLIAIDICNTLADVNKELEKAIGHNPIPSSYYHPKLTDNFFKKNLWVFTQAKAIEHSLEVLKKLSKNNKLIYITARPIEAKAVTIGWLKNNGYPDGEVIFTNNKAAIAKQLGVQLAIDDAPHEIESYCKAGIEVLVKQQPYNIQYPNRFEWAEI